ncbi:MAG: PAS domain-containing protein [Rhizobiales bacterium]|nr:PAS domain-containing protein [Hyphomicrobiales bacterium]
MEVTRVGLRLQDVSTSIWDHRPPASHVVLFSAAFVVAAGVGQWLATTPGITIIVWPPNGVYIACLLLNHRSSWPWWVLIGLLAELTCNALWFGNTIPLAIAYHGANAAGALTSAWLLGRFFPQPARLRTLQQVIAFILFAVVLAPVLAATIGSAIDAAIGKQPFITTWPLWWIGDATGILIAAPLSLVMIEAWRDGMTWSLAHAADAIVTCIVLLGLGILGIGEDFSFAYLILPALLWAAVSFEFAGGAVASALVVLLVAVLTLKGVNDVGAESMSAIRDHVVMQLFLAITALTALVVAAISREHRQAVLTLKVANDDLETRVAERAAKLRDSEARLQLALSAGRAGTWDYDKAGGKTTWSEGHFKLLGIDPAPEGEASRLMWMRAIHPEDRAAFKAEWRRAERTRELFVSQFRIRRQDNGAIVHLHATGEFAYDDSGQTIRFRGVLFDVSELERHQQQQRVLINELNHRVKNTLATVQSIAMQTLRSSSEIKARDEFIGRLTTLAGAHDLLALENWEGASLEDVVARAVAPHSAGSRVRIAAGQPSIWMPPRQALAITMALHELSTNAIKYGALSSKSGHVHITWTMLEDGNGFRLIWCEQGGPVVAAPSRRGFGSKLLERGLKQDLNGEVTIEFRPSGVVCTIEAPPGNGATAIELDLKKGA